MLTPSSRKSQTGIENTACVDLFKKWWMEGSQGRCDAACGQASPEDFTGIYQMPGSTTEASQDTTHLMALSLDPPVEPPEWG